jgi:hypothetical protein
MCAFAVNPESAAADVLPSADADEAIAVLDRMLVARTGDPRTQTRSDEFFSRDYGDLWSELCRDGWPFVAISGLADSETADEEGLGLVDLLALAETWGRHLVPLPLLETILVRRWSGAGPAGNEALTFAVGGRTEPLAPYGNLPGVSCVDRLPSPADHTRLGGSSPSALGSPSYPLAAAPHGTVLGSEVRREIVALAVAEAAGGAGLCLERSLAYAKTRTQFGRLIGAQQAVKHHLANMHMDTELARSSALAVALADRGGIWPRAKLGFDYCAKVWETAIQVHGGIGYTWEGGLHYYAWQLQGLRVVAQAAAGSGADGTPR